MFLKLTLTAVLVLSVSLSCIAQEPVWLKPPELEVLKAAIGVWHAQVEVWPEGPDSPSILFDCIETNRPYGDYWIISDFEFFFKGGSTKGGGIFGYDLDKKKLVGITVDDSPFAGSMTGKYDPESKTVHWTKKAKDAKGNPIVQKSTVTQVGKYERVLVMMTPGEKEGEFVKTMEVHYFKRKEPATE